jgi:hypothetical protein
MSEPHDVVKLLVARMESHPEEFESDGEGRWAQWLDELIPFTTEAERVLLRGPMMQDIHERVLDELMNGPERRRKEAEERELIMKSALAQQQSVQQQLAAQQQQLQGYRNAVGQRGAYDYDLDRYRNATATGIAGQGPSLKAVGTTGTLPVANGGTGAILPVSAINQIKQALGIKK